MRLLKILKEPPASVTSRQSKKSLSVSQPLGLKLEKETFSHNTTSVRELPSAVLAGFKVHRFLAASAVLARLEAFEGFEASEGSNLLFRASREKKPRPSAAAGFGTGKGTFFA